MRINFITLSKNTVETTRNLTKQELKDLQEGTITIFDLDCVDFDDSEEIDSELQSFKILNKNDEVVIENENC